MSFLPWCPSVSLLCRCSGLLALSPNWEAFRATPGDARGWFFYFSFTSQIRNSPEDKFAPRNALLTHLGLNSRNLIVSGLLQPEGTKSRSQQQQGQYCFSGSVQLLWSSRASGSPGNCLLSLGSWQGLLGGEELAPAATRSVPCALFPVSCSEFLDDVPSRGLKG